MKRYSADEPAKDVKAAHGTMAAYREGCRCIHCRKARSDYEFGRKSQTSDEKKRFTTLLGRGPDHPDFPHGTANGYRHCKCDVCKAHNAARKRELNAKYRDNPGARERQQRLNREYKDTEEGRARRRAHHATRKAAIRGAECSPEQKELLVQIYRHCPDGYQVDHIIPIAKGGKHLPDNLQYLPAGVNNRKRTRLDFDCSAHVLRWQDLLAKPSTTIPQGSTAKRPEVPGDLIRIHG